MSEVDRLLGQPFLGGYVITRKIGEGGMGAVYLAENPELQTRWAVKVLLPERSSSPMAVARFKAEARAASRIQHRNIVAIHDLSELADGRHYIAMEYLEGATLRRYARGLGRMPVDVTLAILAQVCAGLQAAHDRGIIHRDLKPSNIFVAPQPDNPYFTKLLDFGIAKLSDRSLAGEVETQSQTVAGTPNYMSPEQARALRDVDHLTDIYAVGCIAYELLTGRLPYRAHSVGDLVYQQASQDPRRPRELRPDLPEPWDALIWSAIDLDKSRRPESAQAFARQMIDATPRGMDVAKARATLLFTTMSESGSGAASDPLATLSSAPARDPTGVYADERPQVSRTESVQKDPDDFDISVASGAEGEGGGADPDEDEDAETRRSISAARRPVADFSELPGGARGEETRAASPAALQRSRSQAHSKPPPAASAAASSEPAAPSPSDRAPGAPEEGTPTTLGFSASEKSSQGMPRAGRGRRSWSKAAGAVAALAAAGVAVFLILAGPPWETEDGSGPGAEEAAPKGVGGESRAASEGPSVRPLERAGGPAVKPLIVEADAAVSEAEEEGDKPGLKGSRRERDGRDQRGREGRRGAEAPEGEPDPEDPDELFEMRK